VKKCPYCAEEIQDGAIICRFCNRTLIQPERKRSRRKWATVLLALIGITEVAVAAGLYIAAAPPKPVRPPPTPTVPSDLRAIERTTDSITLKWTPRRASGETFVIYRGRSEIGTAAEGTSTFRDEGLRPASAYTYRVAARIGARESDPSSPIEVETATPPLAEARLEGEWKVLYDVTGSNLSNAQPGTPLSFDWMIASTCESGPCSARFHIPLEQGALTGRLRRDGADYDGTIENASLGSCGARPNPANDSAVISLTVTRATLRKGEWVAIRFEGSFQEHFPPRPGCSEGFLEADLKGIRRAPRPTQ
jgi:predicted nucleic acid-binding Zn ribbon protein